ncbi:MAG: hypothetical protein ACYS8X_09880 [Planctomycetota bacterium]|jgi:hypothetical protein
MRILHWSIAILLLFCATSLVAQEAVEPKADGPDAPTPSLPDVEAVIEYIPANSAGFFLVNRIETLLTDLNKFGQAVSEEVPEDALLGGLIAEAKLGEGFNPKGGFAFVMLDPEDFNIDVDEMFEGMKEAAGRADNAGTWTCPMHPEIEVPQEMQEMPCPMCGMPLVPKGDEEDGAEERSDAPAPPFVMFVPGTSIEEVFGAQELSEEGGYTQVQFSNDQFVYKTMFATTQGGYILLSPRTDALEAVTGGGSKFTDDLSEEELAKFAEADAAFHIDATVSPEMLDAGMSSMKMMGEGGRFFFPLAPADLGNILEIYGTIAKFLFEQMETMTVWLDSSPTAMNVMHAIAFDDDSLVGKALAAYEGGTESLLNRLPDMPYVAAMGFRQNHSEASKALNKQLRDMILALPSMKETYDEELLQRDAEIDAKMDEQVTGMQFVFGGAPAESGTLAMALVIACKDADTVKGLLAESTEVQQGMINQALEAQQAKNEARRREWMEQRGEDVDEDEDMPSEEEELQDLDDEVDDEIEDEDMEDADMGDADVAEADDADDAEGEDVEEDTPAFTLTYTKSAETVDGLAVDRIDIDLPEEDAGDPELENALTNLFGSADLNVLVAAPDAQTVVLTFGGGEAMLTEALAKAKAADGTVATEETATEVMAIVPEDAFFVGVLDMKHLADVVGSAAEAVEPGAFFPLKYVEAAKPFVAYGVIRESRLEGGLHIPVEPIQQVSQSVMRTMQEEMQREDEAMPVPDDGPGQPMPENGDEEDPGF